MLSLLDIAERMQRGPKMDENAWNTIIQMKNSMSPPPASANTSCANVVFKSNGKKDSNLPWRIQSPLSYR